MFPCMNSLWEQDCEKEEENCLYEKEKENAGMKSMQVNNASLIGEVLYLCE
jgi:hypothetical protein